MESCEPRKTYYIEFTCIVNGATIKQRYAPYVTDSELEELSEGLNIIATQIINNNTTNALISFTIDCGDFNDPALHKTTLVLTNIIGFQTDIDLTIAENYM